MFECGVVQLQASEKRTAFLIARESDALGMALNSTTTRESMIYSAQLNRMDQNQLVSKHKIYNLCMDTCMLL